MLFELGVGLVEVVWGFLGNEILKNFVVTASEGLAEELVDKVFGGREALEQDQTLAVALRKNERVLEQFMEAQKSLAQIQAQQGLLNLEVTQRLGEANLELAWRKLEQEGLIEAEKLRQRQQLAQQEIAFQVLLQKQSLQVQERQHEEILAAQHKKQVLQIQANWDEKELGTIFSRAELEQMETDRLQFICAQMRISPGCPPYFRENLGPDSESQLLLEKKKLLGLSRDTNGKVQDTIQSLAGHNF